MQYAPDRTTMTPSVFRSLLGDDLDSLGGALQRFSENPNNAHGQLTVTHHPGRMARFFIWILRLPAEGTQQVTTIRVECSPTTETWNRVIGRSKFRTRHRAKGGYLEERAGPFRFLHDVSIDDGVLRYRQAHVYLLGIKLPRVFSPIIDAEAQGDNKGWTLDLTVSCPRCGPICHYTGWIEAP